MVTQVQWEDSIIWDGEEEKNKIQSSNKTVVPSVVVPTASNRSSNKTRASSTSSSSSLSHGSLK
jgi:hypothetical protein